MIGKKLVAGIGRRGVLGGALGLGAGAAMGGRNMPPVQPMPGAPVGGGWGFQHSGPANPFEPPDAVVSLWRRREDVTRAYLSRPRIAGLDLDLAALRGVSPTWICIQQTARDHRHQSVVDKLRDEAQSLLDAAQNGVGAMLGLKP